MVGFCLAPRYESRMLDFGAIESPFARLRALLAGLEPGLPPVDMTIGEPRHGMPDFLPARLREAAAGYAKYPPINGTGELRAAIAGWIARRYPALADAVDPDRHILPLNGSREGLFSAIFPAIARKSRIARPAVLIPNPFYQAYLAAALAAGAEPVYLPATAETGHLPDLDAIPTTLLARTAAIYLASPANPQGAVADSDYLKRLIGLVREHDIMLFADECYSEIYTAHPPPGMLEAAFTLEGSFRNVLVFNSLSKRSNVPGLRSGFIAGDADFLGSYGRFRNVACPQMPLPVQHASAALWSDEDHVAVNRALYQAKFNAAAELLGGHIQFIPAGSFFLWLDLTQFGGGEAAAKTFWKGYGVKILPGAYLAQTVSGKNPGEAYARLALVDSLETVKEGLTRIARFMG